MSHYEPPPSPAELRRRRERRRAVLLASVALIVLSTIIGVWAIARWGQVRVDPETLCPRDAQPTAQIVVLLDVTDSLGAIQQEFVRKTIGEIQDSLPELAEFSLYALRSPATPQLSPAGRLCNPGSGDDANWYWQNPTRLQRRWEDGFKKPLDALLQEALHSEDARSSPIMEQIQATSVAAFDRRVERRELVLISDLLQNSEVLRMYDGGLDFEAFRATPAFERARCDLPGVTVRVVYLLRPNSPFLSRRRSHVGFWERYFESCGARVDRVDTSPGLE